MGITNISVDGNVATIVIKGHPTEFNAIRRTILGFIPHKSLQVETMVKHNKINEFYLDQIIRNIPIKHTAQVGANYLLDTDNTHPLQQLNIFSKHIIPISPSPENPCVKDDILLFTLQGREFLTARLKITDGVAHDHICYSVCNSVEIIKHDGDTYNLRLTNNGEMPLDMVVESAQQILISLIDSMVHTLTDQSSGAKGVMQVTQQYQHNDITSQISFTLMDKVSIPMLLQHEFVLDSRVQTSVYNAGHPLESFSSISILFKSNIKPDDVQSVILDALKKIKKKLS